MVKYFRVVSTKNYSFFNALLIKSLERDVKIWKNQGGSIMKKIAKVFLTIFIVLSTIVGLFMMLKKK